MVYQLEQQFRSAEQWVRGTGGHAPFKMSPAELAQDIGMRWKTSTQVSGRLAELQMEIMRSQAEQAKMQMAAAQMGGLPQPGGAPGMPAPGPDFGMPGASPAGGLQSEASMAGTKVAPSQTFGGF